MKLIYIMKSSDFDVNDKMIQYMLDDVSPIKPNLSKTQSLKEGLTMTDLTNLQQDLVEKTKQNPLYDFSNNLLIPPTNNIDYIPTLRDTAMHDTNQILTQQNNIFIISCITGLSFILLGIVMNKS